MSAINFVDVNNEKHLLCLDREKAKEYFHKVYDIILGYLMSRFRSDDKEKERKDDLDEVIADLQKENVNVLDGFRELIILELKEYIYNYENCKGDSYDIDYNKDYCDQYSHIVEYFGYYEYYENHTYDPKHFVITPESLYDFVNAPAT
jgi:hypothetical protein